ncbi:MAG: Eukaryotic translation initiation factor 3 subunit H [Paramarteilia canceri]
MLRSLLAHQNLSEIAHSVLDFINLKNSKTNPSDQLKSFYETIDDLNNHIWKHNSKAKNYMQQINQRNNFRDKRAAENEKRRQRGEDLLPFANETDLDSVFGELPTPNRLENLICLNNLQSYLDKFSESTRNSFKLMKAFNEVSEKACNTMLE